LEDCNKYKEELLEKDNRNKVEKMIIDGNMQLIEGDTPVMDKWLNQIFFFIWDATQ